MPSTPKEDWQPCLWSENHFLCELPCSLGKKKKKKFEYFKARSGTLLAIQPSCTRLWNVTSYQSTQTDEVPACTFCECGLSQTRAAAAARQDSSQVPLGSIWNIAASSSLQIPACSTSSWKASPLLTAQVQWPRAAAIASFSVLFKLSTYIPH